MKTEQQIKDRIKKLDEYIDETMYKMQRNEHCKRNDAVGETIRTKYFKKLNSLKGGIKELERVLGIEIHKPHKNYDIVLPEEPKDDKKKIPTYCINLDRRKDRRQSMQAQFNKFDILDAEFIDAIDGRTIKAFPPKMRTANKFACLQSHKKAIQKAIIDEVEFALICEDDIILNPNLDEILSNLEFPEDWDMLYLGYFPMPEIHGEPADYSEDFIKLYGQMGAFAYIVRNTVMDKILTSMNEPDTFTDNKLFEIQKQCNAYCTNPFLCYVKKDYSDLSEQVVEYEQIKEKYRE